MWNLKTGIRLNETKYKEMTDDALSYNEQVIETKTPEPDKSVTATIRQQSELTDKERFERLTKLWSVLIKLTDETKTMKNKKKVLLSMCTLLSLNLDFLHVNANLALVVKQKLHQFITIDRLYSLIPIYDTIFNDQLYADIQHKPEPDEPIIITRDLEQKLREQYKADIAEYQQMREQARFCKFETGEICGVKDKEGRWWLGRVLKVFQYNEHAIYYVEFAGWAESFNEFITDRFRIEKFNPHKHRLYRPADREIQLKE